MNEKPPQDVRFEYGDHVATVTLARPHRRNAFTLEMMDQIAEFFRVARVDRTVRVVVVRGQDGHFCSGVDLDAFHGESRNAVQNKQLLWERVHRVALALEDFDKPVIAAIEGNAVGAGMDMALMCDIRVACTDARFSQGYVRVGLVPGDGGCFFLPRQIGLARALELMWTGEQIDAHTALDYGLVSHVWDPDTFDQELERFVRRLASAPPIAVRTIKRAAVQGLRHDLRTALDLISSHQAVVQSSADSAEAYRAFRERREPSFHDE